MNTISLQLFATLFCFTLLLSCNFKQKNTAEVLVQNKLQKNEVEKNTLQPKKSNITKAFVLGHTNYKQDSLFVKIASTYSTKSLYLQKEVYESFIKMHQAAKQDNIRLSIISGTRNFKHQKGIWERKWEKYKHLKPLDRAKKILQFSAMPSTSRHHWGTDLDLNSLNNLYFNSGKGKQEYQWLVANANAYGFYQVYTNKNNGRTGYNEEKWHWSYLPLAKHYLAFYNANITYKDIVDFKGANLAETLQMLPNYVNGISKKAKE